jgi:hypothetical protein
MRVIFTALLSLSPLIAWESMAQGADIRHEGQGANQVVKSNQAASAKVDLSGFSSADLIDVLQMLAYDELRSLRLKIDRPDGSVRILSHDRRGGASLVFPATGDHAGRISLARDVEMRLLTGWRASDGVMRLSVFFRWLQKEGEYGFIWTWMSEDDRARVGDLISDEVLSALDQMASMQNQKREFALEAARFARSVRKGARRVNQAVRCEKVFVTDSDMAQKPAQ